MSFDLWSFRCPEGWDPKTFHSQLIGLENAHVGVAHSVKPRDRAKSLAFAECLHRDVDDLVEITPVEHDEAFALHGELLIVTVSRALAEINVPYRNVCSDAQLLHALQQCTRCARAVAGHDTLFDAELNRVVDPELDAELIVRQFRRGAAAAPPPTVTPRFRPRFVDRLDRLLSARD